MHSEDQIPTDKSSTLDHEILIVDDDRANLELMEAILLGAGYKVRSAANGKSALKSIKAKHPSLVLLNIILPEIDGFEVCTRLRADFATRDIPIIFISALEDRDSKIMGYRKGGIDYIVKPIFKEEILTKVKLHLETRQILTDLEILNSKYLSEITERKLVEKSEKENEERYRTLFENAPIGYQSLDINGFFIEVNETWLQTLGYSRDEVIGKWFGDFLTPKYIEGFRERFPIFKSLGKIHSEFEMIKKDGSIVFIAFEGRIGYTSTGEFKQTHCVLNDITQRKQAEKELQHARDHFQTIFEQAPLGIALVDSLTGKMLEVNSKFAEITGRSREEMESIDWMGITHPDDLQPDLANQERMNAGEITGYRVNKRYIRPDGSLVWVSVIVAKVDVGEKMNPRHLTMIEDITDRNRAQEAIKINEARLESLLRINQYSSDNIQELLDFALEEVILLTASKIGYIYFYDDERKEFTLNSWSREVMHECTVKQPETKYQLESTGIWGEAVRQGQPIIVNDFNTANPLIKGIPDGHIGLEKFLTIPVIFEGHVVAVVGVANKQTDYDRDDVRQLNLMMEGVWRIVQRKNAETDLLESEQKFRDLFENSPIGKLMTWMDGSIHVNESFCAMTGYTEAELKSLTLMDITHPDDIQATSEALQSLLNGPITSARLEKRFLHKNGGVVWADLSIFLQRDKEGNPCYYINSVFDVTDRKKTEEALLENEELLSLFIEHSPIHAYIKMVTPTESRVFRASENFKDMIGISGSEMVGKTMEELFSAEQAKKFTADDWDVVSAGKILKVEESLNGRYYNTIKFPITLGGKKKLAGYSIDITDRKLSEEKIRRFNEELEQLVQQRTIDLNETILELEEQTRVFVGRELVMIELKEKIEELEKQLNER